MRKWLGTIILGAVLIASPAYAQVRPEMGGTGSLTNTGTDNSFIVGLAAGTSYGEEVPSGSCTSSTFLRFDATAADGSRLVCATPAGTGDITAVGPMYASGDAFVDGITTGAGVEFLVIEGTTANLNEYHFNVPAADPASDITYTFPSATGTLVTATDNIATATALAANPGDCSANQFANAIVASGDLTCAAIADADVPNTITIDLAATATALAANGGNCTAGSFPLGVDASGAVETCTAISARVIIDENAGGTLLYDGADKVFSLANTPGSCDAVQIAFNGYDLKKVATVAANNEFSCSGSTITLNLAPRSGDQVQASYTL